MPNYYNPYNFYPVTYPAYGAMNPMQTPTVPMQQSQASVSMKSMEWVEGEVGAKAFQRPTWLADNTPIPLWDSTDTVIWLKSWSPMGFPNPMQKLRYEMPEQQSQMTLPAGQSGSVSGDTHYVTREELETMKREILDGMQRNNSSMNNQNGNRNNRGGDGNGKPTV